MNIYYLLGSLAIWPAPPQLTLAWARTGRDWLYAARTGGWGTLSQAGGFRCQIICNAYSMIPYFSMSCM